MAYGLTSYLDSKISQRVLDRIEGHALILYDGECGFCQFWIQQVLRCDKKAYFLFSPLQASWAKPLHSIAGRSLSLDTVILIQDGRVYKKTRAVFRILGKLKFPINLFRLLLIVPAFICDPIYDLIAARRHFIKLSKKCDLPTPSERQRFLEDEFKT